MFVGFDGFILAIAVVFRPLFAVEVAMLFPENVKLFLVKNQKPIPQNVAALLFQILN